MAAAGDENGAKRRRTGAATRQPCWFSTITDDLVAVIYRMLASPRGRARFPAVCRSWRAAAREAAPSLTTLPWLLLSPNGDEDMKPAYCPEDGTVLRLQSKIAGRKIVGGYPGGWVICEDRNRRTRARIMNLFSGAEVTLGEDLIVLLHADLITKVIFSQAPDSPDCILAAMSQVSSVLLSRVACPKGMWNIKKYPSEELADIAFHDGELYVLCRRGELVKFDIGVDSRGAPVVTSTHRLATNHPTLTDYPSYNDYKTYMFDLNGKLAMALRTKWSIDHQPFFKVFELVDAYGDELITTYSKKWMEVTSLGDHALFLGRTFSKAVCIPADTHCGGVERNVIYFFTHSGSSHRSQPPEDAVFLTISNGSHGEKYSYTEDDKKFYRKDDFAGVDIEKFRSVAYFSRFDPQGGMWILPPDI